MNNGDINTGNFLWKAGITRTRKGMKIHEEEDKSLSVSWSLGAFVVKRPPKPEGAKMHEELLSRITRIITERLKPLCESEKSPGHFQETFKVRKYSEDRKKKLSISSWLSAFVAKKAAKTRRHQDTRRIALTDYTDYHRKTAPFGASLRNLRAIFRSP